MRGFTKTWSNGIFRAELQEQFSRLRKARENGAHAKALVVPTFQIFGTGTVYRWAVVGSDGYLALFEEKPSEKTLQEELHFSDVAFRSHYTMRLFHHTERLVKDVLADREPDMVLEGPRNRSFRFWTLPGRDNMLVLETTCEKCPFDDTSRFTSSQMREAQAQKEGGVHSHGFRILAWDSEMDLDQINPKVLWETLWDSEHTNENLGTLRL